MRKYWILAGSVLITICIVSIYCVKQSAMVEVYSKNSENISKYPKEEVLSIEKIDNLPQGNHSSSEEYDMDLIGRDLRGADLSSRSRELMYSSFNSSTKWPDKLPGEFSPEKIMEDGKNPGLNLRQLHSKGIKGKGIGIAIIDNPLLVDHIEYKDNIKFYEEIGIVDDVANFHGGLVSSIAVGKSTGIAPEANLYYIAARSMDGDGQSNFKHVAEAIHKILDINRSLDRKSKIRVISISNGWIEGQRGYKEITEAINRAKKEGVFIVSSMLIGDYGYFFDGLGREPSKNPDEVVSFEPSIMYRYYYYNESNIHKFFQNRVATKFKLNKDVKDILYVPMDSRAFASPYGKEDYIFQRRGGWSSCSPYLAGVYALACQVYPKITPEIFWKMALETGDSITFTKNNKEITMEKVVNPLRLIEKLMELK